MLLQLSVDKSKKKSLAEKAEDEGRGELYKVFSSNMPIATSRLQSLRA
jgi:hypothetical protein